MKVLARLIILAWLIISMFSASLFVSPHAPAYAATTPTSCVVSKNNQAGFLINGVCTTTGCYLNNNETGVLVNGVCTQIGSPCVLSANGKTAEGSYNSEGLCAPRICGSLPDVFCYSAILEPSTTTNPLGGLQTIVNLIANTLIGLYGVFAVFVLIVSGVQISASAGSKDAIATAKSNIAKVVTGLVLLISARAIIGIINNLFTSPSVIDTGKLFCPTSGGLGAELCPTAGVNALLGNAITVASFASGIIAVIFLIIGGIRYITSAGNPVLLKGATRTITFATLGLVISLSAYGILVFIQSQLTR